MYSFRISVCTVPLNSLIGMLFFIATEAYIAVKIEAGALIVIDVLTSLNGISLNNISISFSEEILHPHFPTSPIDLLLSASYPYNVGISNAMLNPVCPFSIKYFNLLFVSSGVPNPENILIVHFFPLYIFGYGPLVYGKSPGNKFCVLVDLQNLD